MAEVDSCFEHGLGLDLQCLPSSCSTHVCYCATLHVAMMLCCPWVSALDQWSFFHGLAASERSEVCIAGVVFMLDARFGTYNICLHHGRMIVGVPHHMWLSSCVAPGCRLWTNGRSSMGLQGVSVRKYVWPGLCHALSMVWDLALQCLLAP